MQDVCHYCPKHRSLELNIRFNMASAVDYDDSSLLHLARLRIIAPSKNRVGNQVTLLAEPLLMNTFNAALQMLWKGLEKKLSTGIDNMAHKQAYGLIDQWSSSWSRTSAVSFIEMAAIKLPYWYELDALHIPHWMTTLPSQVVCHLDCSIQRLFIVEVCSSCMIASMLVVANIFVLPASVSSTIRRTDQ